MSSRSVIIGSDHAGYQLKEMVKQELSEAGYAVEDIGAHNEDSIDYPPIAREVATKAVKQDCFGVVVCGSGNGVTIAANKVAGVRAVNAHDADEARQAREHNGINVLGLAGRRLKPDQARKILKSFLETPFAGGRHERRVKQLEN